jgi:hypothetical protein
MTILKAGFGCSWETPFVAVTDAGPTSCGKCCAAGKKVERGHSLHSARLSTAAGGEGGTIMNQPVSAPPTASAAGNARAARGVVPRKRLAER